MKKWLIIFLTGFIFILTLTAAADVKPKTVYVTFDDGPTLNTPDILEILSQYDAKATFFLLDDRITKYPNYVVMINAAGHSIGLHGVSHDFKTIYSTPSMPLSEMNIANDTLYALMGFRTRLVRTPYGSYPYMSDEQYKIITAANLKLWDWTIDPKDSIGTNIDIDSVMRNIRRDLKNTDTPIILLHDRKSTVRILPTILKYFKDEQYTFSAIDENMTPVNFMELYGKNRR